MRGYVVWMLVAAAMALFIYAVREGPIHVAAWAEACSTLRTGGAIEGIWSTVSHCNDIDPRRHL